jgi:hypothetical protein
MHAKEKEKKEKAPAGRKLEPLFCQMAAANIPIVVSSH